MGLESGGKKDSTDTVGVRRCCGSCYTKTAKTEVSHAVSKITPMHIQNKITHALDHNEARSVRLSKYLDIEDRFVHFNATRNFLKEF